MPTTSWQLVVLMFGFFLVWSLGAGLIARFLETHKWLNLALLVWTYAVFLGAIGLVVALIQGEV